MLYIFVKNNQRMADANNISVDEIKALKLELRGYSFKWVQKVAIKMSTKKEPVDKMKVYNIVNRIITDPYWVNKFLVAAKKVLEDFQSEEQVEIIFSKKQKVA